MATYSAFFSSGLLAPHHFPNYQSFRDLSTNVCPYDDDALSPTTPSSPLPDSDMELDIEREVTPTPSNTRIPPRSNSTSSFSSQPANQQQQQQQQPPPPPTQPRLRKRRSSLTVASNPMNTIRSPTRAAGAALQLQMHLTSPSRSRSGSLSVATSATANHPIDTCAKGEIASQATSMMGRMRSGSVGTALRPRRGVRRLASVPAAAPPPTAPLPALPPFLLSPLQDWNGPLSAPLSGSFSATTAAAASTHPHPSRGPVDANNNNNNNNSRPPFTVRTLSAADPMKYRMQNSTTTTTTKGRDRSFSLGQGMRIDEEMKEN